ncbi:MAG: YciI family protein [Cellvibrionaceae bacterium]
MFVVLLKFSTNKANAKEYMDGHNAWIKQGFDDGVFLLVGSIEPAQGGSIIAHNVSREELEARVGDDPFVSANIVTAEIIEISLKKTDERLGFLMT